MQLGELFFSLGFKSKGFKEAKDFTKLINGAKSSLDKMSASLSKASKVTTTSLGEMNKGFKETNTVMDRTVSIAMVLKNMFSGLGSIISTLAKGFMAAGAAVLYFLKSSSDIAVTIDKLSAATGTAIGKLYNMKKFAAENNVEFDSMASSLERVIGIAQDIRIGKLTPSRYYQMLQIDPMATYEKQLEQLSKALKRHPDLQQALAGARDLGFTKDDIYIAQTVADIYEKLNKEIGDISDHDRMIKFNKELNSFFEKMRVSLGGILLLAAPIFEVILEKIEEFVTYLNSLDKEELRKTIKDFLDDPLKTIRKKVEEIMDIIEKRLNKIFDNIEARIDKFIANFKLDPFKAMSDLTEGSGLGPAYPADTQKARVEQVIEGLPKKVDGKITIPRETIEGAKSILPKRVIKWGKKLLNHLGIKLNETPWQMPTSMPTPTATSMPTPTATSMPTPVPTPSSLHFKGSVINGKAPLSEADEIKAIQQRLKEHNRKSTEKNNKKQIDSTINKVFGGSKGIGREATPEEVKDFKEKLKGATLYTDPEKKPVEEESYFDKLKKFLKETKKEGERIFESTKDLFNSDKSGTDSNYYQPQWVPRKDKFEPDMPKKTPDSQKYMNPKKGSEMPVIFNIEINESKDPRMTAEVIKQTFSNSFWQLQRGER